MIHHSLLSYIRAERRVDDFLCPFYEGFSIAEVIPTLLQSYGINNKRQAFRDPITMHPAWKCNRKILLLADGFGYPHFIKYYKRFPLLHALSRDADVYPITSVFPSTTSAALTSFHTGLTPQEHGIPEWNVYFEEFDSIIQTIPFKRWGSPQTDALLEEGGEPAMLYEGETAYTQLSKGKVASYVFLNAKFANTLYSNQVHRGSTVVPFKDGPDLFRKVRETMESAPKQAYFMVYWSDIDGAAHKHGPHTAGHEESIAEFDRLVRQEFLENLPAALRKDTALLFSADHGHVDIKDEDIIKLNEYRDLEDSYLKGPNGNRILPTGSPHDVFLYVIPEREEQVIQSLRQELIGKAEVITSEEALQRGLFGVNHPSEKFLRRIGNVVVLPHSGHHVWYDFFGTPYDMLGIHGGLTEPEMLVPFGIVELDKLRLSA